MRIKDGELVSARIGHLDVGNRQDIALGAGDPAAIVEVGPVIEPLASKGSGAPDVERQRERAAGNHGLRSGQVGWDDLRRAAEDRQRCIRADG